jgi:pSer/pThr/pTyr-binding forkhead associated (FHA) protein
MYKLVISDDTGHTTVVPVLRDEITIGRQEGNAIRLTERNVSRRHARLVKHKGSYVVEDLGSYNGVILNGKRIDARVELAPGDQLGIGDYDIAFESDAVATATTASPPKPKSLPPPRLVLLGEPAAGAEFTLTKPAFRIGRDERLDIWINHKSISHEHAEIQVSDGKVTVFDLESANGIRVNGVATSRAVLESGDVLEIGEVRFRYLAPQGVRSLEALAVETQATHPPSPSRKPVFVLSVIGLLVVAGAGAVLATMRGAPRSKAVAAIAPQAERMATEAQIVDEPGAPSDADLQSIDQPREWEALLAQAHLVLIEGGIDRAYAIADDLPAHSVLRQTPEFSEIRDRYVQAHIGQGERALVEGDPARAQSEAEVVLAIRGINSKQRQEARSLLRRAQASQVGRIVD